MKNRNEAVAVAHAKEIASAGVNAAMGMFFFLAVIAAFAAWDRQISTSAKDCQEACVRW